MTRIVLIGGGHAHLGVVKRLGKEKPPGLACTLVSADDFQYYSGMFSGYTEGLYRKEEIRIDLASFCRQNGVTFIRAAAEQIDRAGKQVITGSGPLPYDLVSLNTGSLADDSIPGAGEHSLSLKPNFMFPETVQKLRKADFPVIAGGGAAGVELAFSLAAWRTKYDYTSEQVTLLTKEDVLSFSEKAGGKVRRLMAEKPIRLLEKTPARKVTAETVETVRGSVPFSDLLWLTGPKAHPLAEGSGLKTDGKGFLLVTDSLQSLEDPDIFGAGDCVTLETSPELPKNGVYAVRQAPVLYDNLVARAAGNTLKSFEAQKRYLAILSTGGQRGLLLYGGEGSSRQVGLDAEEQNRPQVYENHTVQVMTIVQKESLHYFLYRCSIGRNVLSEPGSTSGESRRNQGMDFVIRLVQSGNLYPSLYSAAAYSFSRFCPVHRRRSGFRPGSRHAVYTDRSIRECRSGIYNSQVSREKYCRKRVEGAL
ncbi:FAD-dependent oxidoreductase [Alteribacter natronophilus]|uniref:FAD-dependent oxidoreductase n=1 Tax=Alteribacter natronophilus TaxID=2583810 RepID=UPI00110E76AD|nr:FAD-dependent oxidoreductase [Alteribacter natronophilus]TMW71670.1 hypothetical protein FGB90_11610 [Alteribacter natronophilus]